MNRRNTLLVAVRFLLPFLLTSETGLFATEPIVAFEQGARVLFQGDSITDGNRGRSADPNHILGHGYVFIIAARHGAQFPQAKLSSSIEASVGTLYRNFNRDGKRIHSN